MVKTICFTRLTSPRKTYLSSFKIIEERAYCFIWTAGVLYALWQFVQATDANYNTLDPSDFTKGWSFLTRHKDSSDIEWLTLKNVFKRYWILLAVQVFITQVLLKRFATVRLVFYALYSLVCLIFIIGRNGTSLFMLYILLMYVIHATGKKILCYSLTIAALLIINHLNFFVEKEFVGSDNMDLFVFEVGLAWLTAKCLSFAVDRIDQQSHKQFHFKDLSLVTAYCFYLPTVFTGPILTYRLFSEQITANQHSWSTATFFKAVMHLPYYLIWYFVLEFLLHFLYSSSIQYYPDTISTFNTWSLCGLGYCLPLLFYLKYFIIYGLAGKIAKLENFDFPPPPKCISAVHLSSYLWRHFDRGLYLWILRYLYLPLVSGRWSIFRKFYALAMCFTFVSVWHGMDKAICMWSALNFLLVGSEMITSMYLSTKLGKTLQRSLSASWYKRCVAAFCTPHFMLMCTSCTFFLSNWDIGMLILKNVICGGWIPVLSTAFIMYCGCHTSMYFKQSSH